MLQLCEFRFSSANWFYNDMYTHFPRTRISRQICKISGYFWKGLVSLFSPIHVVLVSLLVDQLSGLFLIFIGRPKKIVQSLGIFGQSLGIFGWPKKNLVDQKKFWCTKKKFGRPKIPRDWPKIPWDWTIFFWSTKKNEKKTGQLVDQETDQNHMDGTHVF